MVPRAETPKRVENPGHARIIPGYPATRLKRPLLGCFSPRAAGGRWQVAGFEGVRDRSGEARAERLTQDGEVLDVAGSEGSGEGAGRRGLQNRPRAEGLGQCRVLLFVGEHERVRPALRARGLELARFGFHLGPEAPNRLGQSVDVGLVLAAKLGGGSESRAVQ